VDELQRVAARLVLEDSLIDFTRYFFKARFGSDFIVNWHHGAICEHLEAVERGQIRNLIINLPPGGTKTELVSINWPARAIARNPLSRFLALSYADELVALNSQSCRNLIQSDEYQELWPLRVAEDSKAKKRWNIMEGDKARGGMYAATPHAQVTGFRAGYMTDGFNGAIILDDPMKASDAESDVMRNEINSNIARTVRSRRAKPSVPIVVVQQRLHEEDTTGWLLAGHLGEEFEQLKIPALDGSGKSYWEVKEPTPDLEKFKAAQPYIFASQYQQEPAPEEGIYFLREWFKQYDRLPDHLNYYGASDFAVSDKKGDYTVHGVFGVDPQGEIYLVDWWRKQSTSDVWIEQLLDMAKRYHTLGWAMESGVIERAVMPLMRSRMAARNEFPRLASYPSMANKEARARNIQGRMAARGIWVPRQPWASDLIQECINFPNGKHDDQVDVLSLFGNMLANLKPGIIPPQVKETINTELPTIEQIFKMKQRELDTI